MATPGRKFALWGVAAVASPTKSLLQIVSAATIRPGIYDVFLSSDATPADNALLWKAQRFTVAGTAGTTITPTYLDPGDAVAASQLAATTGYACSAEPTYTATFIVMWIALNQRATHRVILDPTAPILLPSVASNGVGVFVVHASFTGNADITVYTFE